MNKPIIRKINIPREVLFPESVTLDQFEAEEKYRNTKEKIKNWKNDYKRYLS